MVSGMSKSTSTKGTVTKAHKQNIRKQTLKLIKRNWILYLFLLPALAYIIVFCYAPMYGVQIAFRDYRFKDGITGSEWVGLKWFIKFFESTRFGSTLWNTLAISLYSLVVSFPLPIMLALIMNNVKNLKYKKFAQTITYMPHFISTVVMVSMLSVFFSPTSGFINTILEFFGGSGNTFFMGESKYFRHMYVWSGVWQGMGWGSIIYMAALAGVDQQLHEAAMIDGANKFKRVWHIDIPSIMPTIAIMLIMSLGSVMSVGYEKTYLMQNNLNIDVSEVISTYVYKVGMQKQQYSFSSAIGLFNNVINLICLLIGNKVVGKLSGSSLM